MRYTLACSILAADFEHCWGKSPLSADIVIKEILASNRLGVQDDDAESSDYVEFYNDGASAVDLAGYGVSDDVSDPFKWVIPEGVIEPGQYLLVWCSGKDRVSVLESTTTTTGGLNIASLGVAR